MRGALRSVANGDRVAVLGDEFHDLVDRIDGSERVRDVIERKDLRSSTEKLAEVIQIEPSVRRQLANLQFGALLQGQLLPRDEVRVMLQCRDDDFVAVSDIGAPP